MAISPFRDIVENTEEQRRTFFKSIFGPFAEGYACIAFKEHTSGKMRMHWFEYPNQLEEMLTSIQSNSQRLAHFWYSTALYTQPGDRHRRFVKYSTVIHCDLDECDPRLLLVQPSYVVQSSPGHYQALWVLDRPIPANEAEDINRRIYYYHRDQGADSCHDAGHLLRIPYTPNYKYGELGTAPVVAILEAKPTRYRPTDFSMYPNIQALEFLDRQDELPDMPNKTAKQIIEHYRSTLGTPFEGLYSNEPSSGEWSEVLWRMMNICLEAGMTKEETFAVAQTAACNKYERDHRSEVDLWRDVNRVYVKQIEKLQLIPTTTSEIPQLITQEEVERVQRNETFVERYIGWAKNLTDAPVQYHQAGAFVALSAILCGNVYLDTSHERIFPNLWFMILAGTTITRKTTAMRLSLNLTLDVDERVELATDATVEGILSGLRDRPGQPSIFHRDEFAGLLDAIANKDYMAGFAEQLTKLYDGDNVKRLLRKETIHVRDPRFIMFAAGIKDKIQALITEEQVMSGFIPRFIIITADADLKNLRLTRPPEKETGQEARELLRNELLDIYNHYVQPRPLMKDGKVIGSMPAESEAVMTHKAWERYNQFEQQMMDSAVKSGLNYLMPVNVRLTVSTLKAAVLIAASRKREPQLVVDEQDVIHAIYYAQRWREYASEIVNGIGKSHDERLIDRIISYVSSSPMGATRAELMRVFRLDVKKADLIFGTMVQRNMLFAIDVGGQKRYRATDGVGA